MHHQVLIATFSAELRRALTARDDGPGIVHLTVHVGLILLIGVLITTQAPYWQVLMLPQGILIIFLFTLLHETIHRTVFSNDRMNDVVARICGAAVLLPSDWFRYFHLAHHRHTHDPVHDPELARPKPSTLRQYLWYLSGLPTWFEHIRTLVRNARGKCDDAFVPARAHCKVKHEARTLLTFYGAVTGASVVLESTALLYAWSLPAMIGQPFLRLYLMAEHTRCPHVSNMFENTRTTFTIWLVRKLAWNMPFHAEHHAYPTVPYHRLPDLHRIAREHLKETERGYTRFHRKVVGELRS